MTPVLVSIDKAGDLKLGARKCRLHKKEDVVKVAKQYGINTEKKTVKQLCGSIKSMAKAINDGMNNVPLTRLYPDATRKRAEKKAQPLTKAEAIRRIRAMKGLNGIAKGKLTSRVVTGTMSPRRMVKLARELSRLSADGATKVAS
jgi:hypothetical protein